MFSGKKKTRAQYDRIEVGATHDGAETAEAEAQAASSESQAKSTTQSDADVEAGVVESSGAASVSQSPPPTEPSQTSSEAATTHERDDHLHPQSDSKSKSTTDSVEVKVESAEEAEDPDAMTLNVKGTDDKTHTVRISDQASVTDLKAKIASITEFGVERQRLIFLGKMLDDAMKLCDYNIKDGNFIHLVPKPAGFVAPSSDDTNGGRHGGGLGDATINLHDIPVGIFRDSGNGFNHNLAYDREYIQTLTLGLWRARIRLLSSLMLFYYFLQLMTNLSFWLHPNQANFQFEDGHHPTDLYFAVDAVENVAGMGVAWWGLKTAADDSTLLSKRFFIGMCRLCIVHFVSLAIYSQQLMSGQIVIKTMRHYNNHPRDQSEVGVSVLFNIMINVMIWATCIGVASRYHGELEALEAQREPARRSRVVEDEEDMENPTVVVVQ